MLVLIDSYNISDREEKKSLSWRQFLSIAFQRELLCFNVIWKEISFWISTGKVRCLFLSHSLFLFNCLLNSQFVFVGSIFCSWLTLSSNRKILIYSYSNGNRVENRWKKRPPLFSVQPITITHSHHFSYFLCAKYRGSNFFSGSCVPSNRRYVRLSIGIIMNVQSYVR